MPNTLGLDDDLDPVDVLVGLEKAFALKISDDEAASCETVGDIYALLQSRFAGQLGAGGACMTSMAFYRLRKALRRRHPDVDFRPSTPLAGYAVPNARTFLNQLRRDSGLLMPGSRGRWELAVVGLLALAALAGGLAAINQGPFWLVAAIGLAVVAVTLMRLDPGVLSGDCATLGDLTTKVSSLNFGVLARSGGAVRGDDLWDAMIEVLSGWTQLSKADIRRDTLILQKQLGHARQ